MTTPRISKPSTGRILFGRFGPALTLAALTALAAMFVVSSLHGCRRKPVMSGADEIMAPGSPDSGQAVSQKASAPVGKIPIESECNRTSDSTSTARESIPNPAESDAFALEEVEPLEPITRAPFSHEAMSPVHPVDNETPINDAELAVNVQVNRLLAAKNVEKRRPIGEADRFEANGESVWAWASVRNAGQHRSHIWMIWKHEGMVRSRVRLGIGKSPRWRTWSRFRMRANHVGHWSVETTDADGMVLERMEFDIIPAEAATTARSEHSNSE